MELALVDMYGSTATLGLDPSTVVRDSTMLLRSHLSALVEPSSTVEGSTLVAVDTMRLGSTGGYCLAAWYRLTAETQEYYCSYLVVAVPATTRMDRGSVCLSPGLTEWPGECRP